MEEARLRPASAVVEVSISEVVHFEHNLYRGLYGALAARHHGSYSCTDRFVVGFISLRHRELRE